MSKFITALGLGEARGDPTTKMIVFMLYRLHNVHGMRYVGSTGRGKVGVQP